jgi:predicted nucleic acid-binding protein
MILYLDTSALVKVYVKEAFTSQTLQAMERAQVIATHEIAYVEARSAFARLQREKVISGTEHQGLKKEFHRDWERYLVVENSPELIQRAADLCERYALRAYDSLHLASAEYLKTKQGPRVTFACFDEVLNRAAAKAGLEMKLYEQE